MLPVAERAANPLVLPIRHSDCRVRHVEPDAEGQHGAVRRADAGASCKPWRGVGGGEGVAGVVGSQLKASHLLNYKLNGLDYGGAVSAFVSKREHVIAGLQVDAANRN